MQLGFAQRDVGGMRDEGPVPGAGQRLRKPLREGDVVVDDEDRGLSRRRVTRSATPFAASLRCDEDRRGGFR